jgi:hypothetical protein
MEGVPMAVAFVLDLPTMSPEQATKVVEVMKLGGKPPEGQIFHMEMDTGNGVRVVDCWESEAAFQTFMETRLGPAFAQVGVQFDQPPVPQWLPAQNILK